MGFDPTPMQPHRADRSPVAKLDAFIVVHDQEILLDCERNGRYRNLDRKRFLFVGGKATDKLAGRDDVVIARTLPDNIEQYANLLSFTAWYAIARNGLADEHVAILEYDVGIADGFTARTLSTLEEKRCIAGYVPFKLSHPMYLYATPWFISALRDVYAIDAEGMVRSHLDSGGIDLWTSTTNVGLRVDDLAAFVDWFLPLTILFRDDPIGAHVHERTIPIFCMLNQIENVYVPRVLEHAQARSHGIYAVSQDEARERAAQSEPMIPGD